MSRQASLLQPERIIIHTGSVIRIDDEQLFQFCQINRDLQIERTSDGDIIIMWPDGGAIGLGCAKLTAAFGIWAELETAGTAFGPSTGFILPNNAMRAPDVAWVRNERLAALTDKEWERFLPLCPNFVLELRSPSDSLGRLQRKMEEYCANGAQLGWLLDPVSKSVHIHRPGAAPEILENPATISGEPLLRGFVLDLQKIWAAMERKKH
jgi:Uma2 family endonuclease